LISVSGISSIDSTLSADGVVVGVFGCSSSDDTSTGFSVEEEGISSIVMDDFVVTSSSTRIPFTSVGIAVVITDSVSGTSLIEEDGMSCGFSSDSGDEVVIFSSSLIVVVGCGVVDDGAEVVVVEDDWS